MNGRSFDQLLTLNVGTVDKRSNINNAARTSSPCRASGRKRTDF